MPGRYLGGSSPRLLLLTADQEGCGRRAAHFLASPAARGGLNLMLDFLMGGDPYHRSWNDFKWACSKALGHLQATNLQMAVVYNCNYQPFLKAANMQKKREILREIIQLFDGTPEEFELLLDTIALDGRTATSTSHGDADRIFDEQCLNNPNFQKKGPYVRQSAWYSCIAAADHYDSMWTAWRWLLRGGHRGFPHALSLATAAVKDYGIFEIGIEFDTTRIQQAK